MLEVLIGRCESSRNLRATGCARCMDLRTMQTIKIRYRFQLLQNHLQVSMDSVFQILLVWYTVVHSGRIWAAPILSRRELPGIFLGFSQPEKTGIAAVVPLHALTACKRSLLTRRCEGGHGQQIPAGLGAGPSLGVGGLQCRPVCVRHHPPGVASAKTSV